MNVLLSDRTLSLFQPRASQKNDQDRMRDNRWPQQQPDPFTAHANVNKEQHREQRYR